jgi:phosphomannomutase/phosphoglucomutase
MNITPDIFRAYDIRGIVETALTPENVYLIGKAFGSKCQQQGVKEVVLGRDGRLSGPALLDALTKGLTETGCYVINIGMIPTPVAYYATYELNTGTCIMITGSHNPPEYNGLKMMLAGETLYGETITDLRDIILKEQFAVGKGSSKTVDLEDQYLKRITSDINIKHPMKIAIDCGNGVAGELAPKLFKQLGCEVTELFCDIDGNFPNHHPDPSKPENLKDIIKCIADNNLDLGLAFDGDGDRVGVIDNKGTVIWADRQMILYSRDVISRNPDALIIYDIKCSRLLPQEIEKAGGQSEMWKTGHSFIKARIKETGALLGGEMSGHIFFKERWYGFDDALYAGARMLEILSQEDKPASDIFDALPDSINTPELTITFENEGENFAFIEAFQNTASFDGAKLTTIDGLRADYDNGWGLCRASNTTPSIVIRFEADDKAALKSIQDHFRNQMLAVNADLNLPF